MPSEDYSTLRGSENVQNSLKGVKRGTYKVLTNLKPEYQRDYIDVIGGNL